MGSQSGDGLGVRANLLYISIGGAREPSSEECDLLMVLRQIEYFSANGNQASSFIGNAASYWSPEHIF
jgi:hypothetical protein